MNIASPFLRLLRVDLWVKNVLVFIPLFFSYEFYSVDSILVSAQAFFVFALASSAVYIVNDLVDVQQDRLHPEKKRRPIAAREISESTAVWLFGLVFLASLLWAWQLGQALLMVIVVYLVLHLAYSFWLKQVIFVDVLAVAFGYVLRVVAGAVVLSVAVSEWMIVLIFLLALFSVVTKRRQEVKMQDKKKQSTRKVLSFYTIGLLDQINSVIVPVLLVSYVLYTFQARIHSSYMLATIPIVFYCFFRFLYLIHSSDFGASTSDYKKDRAIIIAGILWAVLVGLALLGW